MHYITANIHVGSLIIDFLIKFRKSVFKNVERAIRSEVSGDTQLYNRVCGGSWRVSAHVIPQQQQNSETTAALSSHFTSLFAREIDLTANKQPFFQVFATHGE